MTLPSDPSELRAEHWDDIFREIWTILADRGQVDAPDSAEYRRVFQRWERCDRPPKIREFILFHV